MGGTPLSLFYPGVHARTHAHYSSSYNRNRKPATANRQRKLWRLFPLFLCVYICVWKRASVAQEPRTALRSHMSEVQEGAWKSCVLCCWLISFWINTQNGCQPEKTPLTVRVLSIGATHPDHHSKNNLVVALKPSGIPLLNQKCINWNTPHHHQSVNAAVLTVWLLS